MTECQCGQKALRGKTLCLKCFAAEDSKGQRTKPNHKEDDIQEAFFATARLIFPKLGKLLFAVPNGGKRNKLEAVRLKKQGVVPGVADIICLVPNSEYSFLCMETKTDVGKQSTHQEQFQKEVEKIGGAYIVFRSANEGIEVLQDYLKTSTNG